MGASYAWLVSWKKLKMRRKVTKAAVNKAQPAANPALNLTLSCGHTLVFFRPKWRPIPKWGWCKQCQGAKNTKIRRKVANWAARDGTLERKPGFSLMLVCGHTKFIVSEDFKRKIPKTTVCDWCRHKDDRGSLATKREIARYDSNRFVAQEGGMKLF